MLDVAVAGGKHVGGRGAEGGGHNTVHALQGGRRGQRQGRETGAGGHVVSTG